MVKLGRRSRKIDRKIRIELRDRSAQHRPKCVGTQTTARSDQNGTKLSNQIAAEKRHVKSCVFGLLIEWALHQRVRNDSNNRTPRLRLTGIENTDLMTDRALIAPVLAGEACIHNRYRLFRIDVVDCE